MISRLSSFVTKVWNEMFSPLFLLNALLAIFLSFIEPTPPPQCVVLISLLVSMNSLKTCVHGNYCPGKVVFSFLCFWHDTSRWQTAALVYMRMSPTKGFLVHLLLRHCTLCTFVSRNNYYLWALNLNLQQSTTTQCWQRHSFCSLIVREVPTDCVSLGTPKLRGRGDTANSHL